MTAAPEEKGDDQRYGAESERWYPQNCRSTGIEDPVTPDADARDTKKGQRTAGPAQ
jgi:hypothetical protein